MNIYDIARLANVSIATVSRVVNDSPRVSEKTKKKVRAIMEENHYTPNVFARGLGLDSMKTIGIICPDVSDAYMAVAVAHLERRLRDFGYDCILYCSGHKQPNKEKSMDLILSKRTDALILVGSTYAGSGVDKRETDYIKTAAKQLPVFLINGYIRGKNIYCVFCDDYQATYDVTTALIKRGRKRILFFSDSHSYSANKKKEGYQDALKDAGLPVLEELEVYTKNNIYTARETLMNLENLEFDSVLATDDGLAVGALKYASEKGLKVPNDLSIIGYNNSELSICCNPELTSVDNKGKDICNITVENLMAVLKGDGKVLHKVQVPCTITKRETTDF